MTFVLFYIAIQMSILVAFAFLASDLRRKEGMRLAVPGLALGLVMVAFVVPVVIYGYTLVTMEEVCPSDGVAIIFTAGGVAIFASAKYKLGSSHTWAGHLKDGGALVTDGIYGYIRHPIYVATYIYIIGAGTVLMRHAPWYAVATAVPFVLVLAGFLGRSAAMETEFLSSHHPEYTTYKHRVHAFLPFPRRRR
jgi:protein-S-isoprenylcysteine O-methyltransferase Ste14